MAVLPAGIARHDCSNAAASLHVEKLYGLPVLLSGLAALVLSNTKQVILNHHHKEELEHLQKLYPKTPAPVVFFLAGTLPASAVLHLRQPSLLGRVFHNFQYTFYRVHLQEFTVSWDKDAPYQKLYLKKIN